MFERSVGVDSDATKRGLVETMEEYFRHSQDERAAFRRSHEETELFHGILEDAHDARPGASIGRRYMHVYFL